MLKINRKLLVLLQSIQPQNNKNPIVGIKKITNASQSMLQFLAI